MATATNRLAVMEFGRFRIDRQRREFLADGRPVDLGDRAFDTLLVLLDGGGAVLGRRDCSHEEQALQTPGRRVPAGLAWRVATSKRGDAEAYGRLVRPVFDDLGEARYFFHYTGVLAALADGLGAAGRMTEAHQLIAEAFARCEVTEEDWSLPELLRVKTARGADAFSLGAPCRDEPGAAVAA